MTVRIDNRPPEQRGATSQPIIIQGPKPEPRPNPDDAPLTVGAMRDLLRQHANRTAWLTWAVFAFVGPLVVLFCAFVLTVFGLLFAGG